ncbi:MAG: hypothetical protein HY287_11350 [Planctomycetes bacterium]|nr:hypothetical protein [Planctomycetota bacterium]MBI3834915.1 hypothetical protein [Planctomycetota bacterium]
MPRLLKRTNRWCIALATIWICLIGAGRLNAQDAEDQAIDAICKLDAISPNDYQRISGWVELQLKKLAAVPETSRPAEVTKFRERFKARYDNKENTPQCKAQLAIQAAGVAVAKFADAKLDRFIAAALARALLDMDRIETLPGLLAGLKSSQPAARSLSARALEKLKTAIVGEKDKLDQTIAALREAGVNEPNSFVLQKIYSAFPIATPPGPVVDAILAILDKRLATRKQSPICDGAEIAAFEFLRTPAVVGAMTPEQRSQLAKSVATFLRLDAERYGAAELSFEEMDRLERSLDAEEDIFSQIVPGKGGKIRDALAANGHDGRAEVMTQSYLWIGNSQNNEAGALNATPLNVPIGAP